MRAANLSRKEPLENSVAPRYSGGFFRPFPSRTPDSVHRHWAEDGNRSGEDRERQ